MGDFLATAKAQEALGIPISDWISFLQLHSENRDPEEIADILTRELTEGALARSEEDARLALGHLRELMRLLTPGSTTE